MNILILTPDRVGSTFLQRYLTIIMQAYDYGKPVINLHELTNGVISYYNEKLQMQVLGKPEKSQWGYWQSLSEIVDNLKNADHYKTSRLALYHLNNREDNLTDKLSFYKYLNENFYIISARRKNLFEHGISWCIVNESKHLNVFTHEEKIHVFSDVYKRGIHVDPEAMTNYLDRYVEYLKWVGDHFNVSTYFNYEKDMPNIDQFVSRLNIFPPGENAKSWKDVFGISWKEWNNCHYLISDMSGLSNKVSMLENSANQLAALSSPTRDELLNNQTPLPALLTRSSLSLENQHFLRNNIEKYSDVYYKIDGLETDRIITSKMPIKLQTLAEKSLLIKNFSECVEVFNTWCKKNQKEDQCVDMQNLAQEAFGEINNWYNNSTSSN
jgi:hypothetical protein